MEDGNDVAVNNEIRSMALTANLRILIRSTMITVEQCLAWTLPSENQYHEVPDYFQINKKPMRLVGLEYFENPLSDNDRRDMARLLSGFFQNTSVISVTGVTVSMNSEEARIMGGWRLLSALCAFVAGKCNMLLHKKVDLGDGTMAEEVSYDSLPQEQQEFFMEIDIRFHCWHGLDTAMENNVQINSWDGYGENVYIA